MGTGRRGAWEGRPQKGIVSARDCWVDLRSEGDPKRKGGRSVKSRASLFLSWGGRFRQPSRWLAWQIQTGPFYKLKVLHLLSLPIQDARPDVPLTRHRAPHPRLRPIQAVNPTRSSLRSSISTDHTARRGTTAPASHILHHPVISLNLILPFFLR